MWRVRDKFVGRPSIRIPVAAVSGDRGSSTFFVAHPNVHKD